MRVLLLVSFLILQIVALGQEVAPAPSDKAVVYFVRANGAGALINFTFFDSEKAIGRFNGVNYMRYECSPGKHMFWARSENRDFIHADVEAGKIYVVEVIPVMGAIKAGVMLRPVNDPNYKMKRIQKLITRKDPIVFSANQLTALQGEIAKVIERGENAYTKLKKEPRNLGNRTFLPEELIFVKKKKVKKKKVKKIK